MMLPSLALVTPAHNEAETIERTIHSMLGQTVQPVKWVIVSDASTDETDTISLSYADSTPWIDFVRIERPPERTFSAKARAFNAGLERLEGISYDVIGNLDADITFDPDYLEFLLGKFSQDSRLGVAGTPFEEPGYRSHGHSLTNLEHVSGACQLFRRKCFQEVGGYQQVADGGIDWIAVTSARMKGWRTQTFPERVCHHHRPMGSGNASGLGVRFRHGRKDYYCGGHPVWQLFRALRQACEKPYVIGGFALLSGYVWAAVTRTPLAVSEELRTFHRGEQMVRLKTAFTNSLRRSKRNESFQT